MKTKRWTTKETIVVDEIIRWDGSATPEKMRQARDNTPGMLSDETPMLLGYMDGELVTWVRTKDGGIMTCHKGDSLVRHGDNYWVFSAAMTEELLRKQLQ